MSSTILQNQHSLLVASVVVMGLVGRGWDGDLTETSACMERHGTVTFDFA
jgi:hypothetical protein